MGCQPQLFDGLWNAA